MSSGEHPVGEAGIPEEDRPDVLPMHVIAYALGHLNTEAKDIVLTVIPHTANMTSLPTVHQRLVDRNAFEHVGPKTFKIQGIIDEMNGDFVEVERNPHRTNAQGKMSVRRRQHAVSLWATGSAGHLLDLSLKTGIPLRGLIGERFTRGEISTTEARLSVLPSLVKLFMEHGEAVFFKDLADYVRDETTIKHSVTRDHVNNLAESGILRIRRAGRSTKIDFGKTPSGKDGLEVVRALFEVVSGMVRARPEFVIEGIHKGQEIVANPKVLPDLVKRSYESTPHTGKKPKIRKKS